MDTLFFDDDRKPSTGIDVDTTLAHFSIITYYVDPQVARSLIPPRFDLELVTYHGEKFALLSVVPFLDQDFRFVRFPWLKWNFAQTNYRLYVVDKETGEHAVWFIGTSLDSMSVAVPRFCWKLPWHHAKINFDCTFDENENRYTTYRMTTANSWANALVELSDSGSPPTRLPGFDNLETGMVILTHPRTGYYFRRDGRLGSYSIWHERLEPTIGTISSARFDLVDSLKLAPSQDTTAIHSVLIQNRVDFTIYLPPETVQGSIGSL